MSDLTADFCKGRSVEMIDARLSSGQCMLFVLPRTPSEDWLHGESEISRRFFVRACFAYFLGCCFFSRSQCKSNRFSSMKVLSRLT